MKMDQNLEFQERIVKYLQQQMSVEEISAFEAEIHANPELKQEFDEYKLTLKGIEFWGDTKLRSLISDTDNELKHAGFFQEDSKPKSTESKFRIPYNLNVLVKYAVAASVALLIVSMYIFFRSKPANETELAFKQYYTPETTKINDVIARFNHAGIAPLTSDSISSDSLIAGLKFYKAQKYNQSVDYLSGAKTTSNADLYRRFYLGMSLMEQKKYNEAATILSDLTNDKDFEMKDDAIWYLGICYLTTEEGKDNAKSLFLQLANNPQSSYNAQAQAILNQLK